MHRSAGAAAVNQLLDKFTGYSKCDFEVDRVSQSPGAPTTSPLGRRLPADEQPRTDAVAGGGVFVGRDEELKRLRVTLDDVITQRWKL